MTRRQDSYDVCDKTQHPNDANTKTLNGGIDEKQNVAQLCHSIRKRTGDVRL